MGRTRLSLVRLGEEKEEHKRDGTVKQVGETEGKVLGLAVFGKNTKCNESWTKLPSQIK